MPYKKSFCRNHCFYSLKNRLPYKEPDKKCQNRGDRERLRSITQKQKMSTDTQRARRVCCTPTISVPNLTHTLTWFCVSMLISVMSFHAAHWEPTKFSVVWIKFVSQETDFHCEIGFPHLSFGQQADRTATAHRGRALGDIIWTCQQVC